MAIPRSLLLLALLCSHALAVDPVPERSLARKGELIFSDDFSSPTLSPAWRTLWPELTVADGALNISQSKPEHSAVGLVAVGRKDLVIAFRFQLGAASSINAVCNDRDYKEGHGGHLCRVSLSQRQIFLADDKERLRPDLAAMKKDPARQAEAAQLLAGRTRNIPTTLDPTRWYDLVIEIVGDEMRVLLDGQAVGYLKSPGLAHPVKSDFYLAVSGRDALFDDFRIWAAEPAHPQ